MLTLSSVIRDYSYWWAEQSVHILLGQIRFFFITQAKCPSTNTTRTIQKPHELLLVVATTNNKTRLSKKYTTTNVFNGDRKRAT